MSKHTFLTPNIAFINKKIFFYKYKQKYLFILTIYYLIFTMERGRAIAHMYNLPPTVYKFYCVLDR